MSGAAGYAREKMEVGNKVDEEEEWQTYVCIEQDIL